MIVKDKWSLFSHPIPQLISHKMESLWNSGELYIEYLGGIQILKYYFPYYSNFNSLLFLSQCKFYNAINFVHSSDINKFK